VLAELHPNLPKLVEHGTGWMTRRRRFAAPLAVGVAIVACLFVVFSRAGADVSLFDTDLHPAQETEVESALTVWGESFRANPQGTQIFVPPSRRRDVLLRLTLAGLPHRYIPTSEDVLDDRSNALTPQSIIDDRRRSGIEGDLVDGLRRIAGVADASVVLTQPTDNAFGDDTSRSQPSAGVQLVMRPGEQLSADAVAGIKRFVAAAYPGLSPERVTVLDATGAVLGSNPAPDRAVAKERRVQTAVQSALDAVFGAGVAIVRVSVRSAGADDQTQTTRVIPHGTLSADVGRERGVESGKTFEKERSVRRFAYDTISERRTTPADAQARMSVAVFLDGHKVDAAGGHSIASLVRAAAGVDLRSGDEVVVETLPFATAPPPSRAADASQPFASKAIAPAAVLVAVALVGFASLPRLGERSTLEPAPLPIRDRAPPAVEPADAATLKSIAAESPQVAAYVLSRLPERRRENVLRNCTRARRADIESYLDVGSDG
jgi:flagellar M-ring protein FliF